MQGVRARVPAPGVSLGLEPWRHVGELPVQCRLGQTTGSPSERSGAGWRLDWVPASPELSKVGSHVAWGGRARLPLLHRVLILLPSAGPPLLSPPVSSSRPYCLVPLPWVWLLLEL